MPSRITALARDTDLHQQPHCLPKTCVAPNSDERLLPGMGHRLGHQGRLSAFGNQADDVLPTPRRWQSPYSNVTHTLLKARSMPAAVPARLAGCRGIIMSIQPT